MSYLNSGNFIKSFKKDGTFTLVMALDTKQFIDLAYSNTFGFTITTEDPDLLRKWAKEIAPKKTCAIASGGESIYLGFLPQDGQVVGVDAAYNSLAVTYLKGKLIESRSTQDLKRLISQGVEVFNKALRQFLPDLPKRLRISIEDTQELVGSTNPQYKHLWERFSDIWLNTADEVIDSSRDHMHNLVLVHGDMADCKRWAEFQLTYPSNAVGYSGFTRSPLNPYDLILLTEQGGCVISSSELPADKTKTFKLEKTANGSLSDHQYYLYRKNERFWTNSAAKIITQTKKTINKSPLRYLF